MRDEDTGCDYHLSLTTELVESRMIELQSAIEKHVQQLLLDSQTPQTNPNPQPPQIDPP
jgi:hypothetical protein